MLEPLSSLDAYEHFIYSQPAQFPQIRYSTLVCIATGNFFGETRGYLVFERNIVLCVQEYLNFELGVIEGYGYEISQPNSPVELVELPLADVYCQIGYPHKDKLYWYDSFPHPNHPELASTRPHHKHIPPDIKHNRVPAPELSFTRPNLIFLITEVTNLLSII